MTEISRRAALTAITAPFAVALAACTSPPDAGPTPPPSSPSTAPGPPDPTGAPTAVPSYGPNGTHYPAGTPWLGTSAATEIEVDADWDAIADAVRGLDAAAVAAGVAIRVRPGELRGGGAGSSRPPVLAGLGQADWSRHVLVCPRDGYGSVSVVDGARIDTTRRLALFGFDGTRGDGLVLTECQDLQLGWGRWSAFGITRGGQRIELHELVLGFRRNPDDTFGIRPTDAHAMTDISRFGCAFGPSIKPEGSDAHCDTVQAEGTGSGEFGPFLSRDCVDFGSSNAAVLLHTAVSRAEFHHSLILGDRLPWRVFPLEPGDYRGEPNAFAGGCQDVRLYDSVVCGAIGRLGYTHVVGSRLSYSPQESQQGRVEGRWEEDPSIADWSEEDILALTGSRYEERELAALWTW